MVFSVISVLLRLCVLVFRASILLGFRVRICVGVGGGQCLLGIGLFGGGGRGELSGGRVGPVAPFSYLYPFLWWLMV